MIFRFIYEMGLLRSGKQNKDSQSRAALPLLAQAGVGVVRDMDVFDLVVDKPIVGQNDLLVDEQDISVIADHCVPLRRS